MSKFNDLLRSEELIHLSYLNMNGCEEEGLYRIPGSNRDVKRWQRRFDTLYDINLFDEEELYDINTIGSMFKSWLRDLPDEIFPKKTQLKIAQECAGATKTPKLLKDELSKLPPFNYYLLFAITCHLSLLHSFSDKNKMDYRNLCICFQPCLRIDGFCFQFLVQDWKSCWQGCWTEKEYLEEEYRYEREGSAHGSDDDRAVSSSGSSQTHGQQTAVQQRPLQSTQQYLPRTEENGSSGNRKASLPRSVRRKASSSASTSLATAQINGNHDKASSVTPASRSLVTPEPQIITTDRLPELKGLSPIKF